jgi:glutamate:GABA antiporter
VLERLFGIGYDFEDTWGVSRTTFEVFTLGTLAVVVGIAVLGYLWRRPARSLSLRRPAVRRPPSAVRKIVKPLPLSLPGLSPR